MSVEQQSNKAIAVWLLVVCALIFSMVVLGGVTRLTHSGLSMVNWAPIKGVVPPLNQQEWQQEFNHYKQFPEYKDINEGMTLDQFKSIFWFEFAHRLLGRTIGLAFLVPFLVFLVRRKIPRALTPQLTIMFILGGLQGLLGWYMVKSGLVHQPHVSQYRLTAHLSAAIAIYGYMMWVALGLLLPRPTSEPENATRLKRLALTLWVVVCVMIISGGFVAGTHSGIGYNTFPTMNGYWIPPGMYSESPWWLNWFENHATIQFDHRLIAWVLIFSIPAFWFYARRRISDRMTRLSVDVLLGVLALQVTLGITTLLLVVPVAVAAMHQAGGLIVFTAILFVNRRLRPGTALA